MTFVWFSALKVLFLTETSPIWCTIFYHEVRQKNCLDLVNNTDKILKINGYMVCRNLNRFYRDYQLFNLLWISFLSRKLVYESFSNPL